MCMRTMGDRCFLLGDWDWIFAVDWEGGAGLSEGGWSSIEGFLGHQYVLYIPSTA